MVDLDQALGRVLAEDVISPEDLPAHPRSSVDGWAVKATDVFGASETIPAFLSLQGEIEMGTRSDVPLAPESAWWIPTGGLLPQGADAVVMVEYSERLGDDSVLVNRPVGPGENVLLTGEDCACGRPVILAGRTVRPQEIGIMAGLGIRQVSVKKKLKIALVSTGDELVAVDTKPLPGQVRDINSHLLAALVRKYGAEPVEMGIVPDTPDRLRKTMEDAHANADLVLISGGSSVGTRDLSLAVIESLPHSRLLFHGISVKPGKPTMAFEVDRKPIIGLPGHPVSALMAFEILLSGLFNISYRTAVDAVLTESVASAAGRDDFVRVSLDLQQGVRMAVPVLGKAGLLGIMTRADGYVHIPYEKQGLDRGAQVSVHFF